MRQCSVCGGNCDPGDIIGDRCFDCIEKEQKEEERKELVRQMLKRNIIEQADGQLVMFYGTY